MNIPLSLVQRRADFFSKPEASWLFGRFGKFFVEIWESYKNDSDIIESL